MQFFCVNAIRKFSNNEDIFEKKKVLVLLGTLKKIIVRGHS